MISLLCIFFFITLSYYTCDAQSNFTKLKKQELRDIVKEMFFHGYNNYKIHAFPADELMPLSCKGRYRDPLNARGDLDYTLGNFSLTMIDSLDSLFLFNNISEFENAVQLVLEKVVFDLDIEVSVFETNIRILGGLLGAHVSALEIRKRNSSHMQWYTDELLRMATDIGNRLLPAFNTSTGIPLPIINLRHGINGVKRNEESTCTACAGTMILEFAALSRLTGNLVYEEKAARALAYLWRQRSRYSDLVGRVINVHSGDWVHRDSGVGAGIDSYYEYLLKAYVLLGEPVYLHRFQTHYEAIKRYVSGPESARFPFLFLDVNMHSPSQRARSFMDALFAFWPGIQVLLGDVKPAVALHEYLFQVHKRNKLMPEAFTPDLRVHWGQHLIRPEFVESTYLLYRATNDPYYLEVGAQIVNDLQTFTRVPCGFAAVEDVRTMQLSDRLDSFVLAETFKYLYLLFAEPSDLPFSLGDYIFTTEAHLLPLSLSQLRPKNQNTSKDNTTSSTPTVQTSTRSSDGVDCHGDRDHLAEERLLHSSTCPAVDVGFDHRLSSGCSISEEATTVDAEDGTLNTCSIWDGPSCHRNDWMLLRLVQPERLTPYACPGNVTQRMWRTIELIREPLRLLSTQSTVLSDTISTTSTPTDGSPISMTLRASDFRPENPEHLEAIRHMGIELSVTKDGRLVLRHDQKMAQTPQMALAGLLFIQELLLLNRVNQPTEDVAVEMRHVVILNPPSYGRVRFRACPAHFGRFPGEDSSQESDDSKTESNHSGSEEAVHSDTNTVWRPLVAPVRVAYPLDGCTEIQSEGAAYPSSSLNWKDSPDASAEAEREELGSKTSVGPLAGSIGLVRRGGCLFIEKAKNLAKAGAVGGIVFDSADQSSASGSPLFTMSGEEGISKDEVDIPFVLLFGEEREQLLTEMRRYWEVTGKPTTVMLTKEFDPSVSFTASLDTLDKVEPSTLPLPPNITFKVISKISLFTDVSTGSVYRLPCRTTGGLSVGRVPGPSLPCSDTNPCTPGGLSVVGMTWNLGLLVQSDETNIYYPHTDQGYKPNSHQWIRAINDTLKRMRMKADCSGFLLALLEAALTSVFNETKTLPMFSLSWASRTNFCMTQLYELARFYHIFRLSEDPNRANILDLSEIRVTLTFEPLLGSHPV